MGDSLAEQPDRGVSRAKRAGISRRHFLAIAGIGGTAVVAGGLAACQTNAPQAGQSAFPATTLAKLTDLKVGQVTQAKYPDDKSPVMLLKLGQRVPDGVGPDGDVVAYSSICTHLGCSVAWTPDTKVLSCPCHFSSFDPARGGIMVMGQATANLPQLILKISGGDVVATGMRGLIWGRQTNLQTLS
jgi:arsenite oxidase small subunit